MTFLLLSRNQKKKTADNISGPTLAEQYIVIADYQKADKWDLNLQAGMVLEVVEKSDSGWWFVNVDDKQGWVPSSYLERKDGLRENTAIRTNLGEDEKYISTENYTPQNADEIALEKGAVVDVLEKNLDGWWFVRSNGQEGIAPSTYLIKTEKAHLERVARAAGVQIIGRLSDISDLLKHSANTETASASKSNVQHILKKQKSLERGGSLRPPPRLNSVTKASDEKMKSLKKTEDHYVTVSEFVDTVGDGITFSKGQIVQVLEKSDSGWWFVKINGKEGWAPASYIQKTHMGDIEEEENVYQDIEDIDSNMDESDSDDSYEMPDTVKEDDEWSSEENASSAQKDTPVPLRINSSDLLNAKHLKGISEKVVVKRPNSRPPPPPVVSKHVDIDIEENTEIKSSTSPGPPVPPPKKVEDKTVWTSKENNTGSPNLHEVLKSQDRPPQPPPKTVKPLLTNTDLSSKPEKKSPLPEVRSKRANNSQEKTGSHLAPAEPKKYSYTEVIPKDQRQCTSQESLVDMLKNKFATKPEVVDKDNKKDGKGDNLLCNTSPKADIGSKGFVLPPKKLQKPETPPKKQSPIFPKRLNHQTEVSDFNKEDGNKNLDELKARFEKQQPPLTKKPVIKPKTVTSMTANANNKLNNDSSVNNRPSVGTSALKAMFEHPNTDSGVDSHKVVSKTSSSSSNSSRISGITAMLNSKFENDKPILKPVVNRTDNSPAKPQLVPSKTNTGNSMALPGISHKPLKSSNPAPLPAKPYSSKPVESNKPKLPIPPKPSKIDKNHNEMESKDKVNVRGQLDILANKLPVRTNVSPVKSEPPTPPVKDYEKLSDCTTTCYKTVADFIAESEGEVGFTTGEPVDVLEQTDDWWFIRVHGEEGWAPAAYIELCERETTGHDDVFWKRCRAITDYVTEAEGEIGLCIGDLLDVIEETETGWWFLRKGTAEGWAPSSYLEPV